MMPSQKRPVTRPQSTQLRVSIEASAKQRASNFVVAGILHVLHERALREGLEVSESCGGLAGGVFVLPEGLELSVSCEGLVGGVLADFALGLAVCALCA